MSNRIVIVLMVVVVALLGLVGFLVHGEKLLGLGNRTDKVVSKNASGDSTSSTKSPGSEDTTDKAKIEPSTLSALVGIDSVWNRYTNNKLGFSIDVPAKMYHPNALCKYSTANGDHSYRPQGGMVPTKVFEDDSTIYISSEYFSQLSGETNQDGRSYFSGCKKVVNSLDRWKSAGFEYPFWAINTAPVNSDEELLEYIRNTYGSSCGLGDKKPTTQAGVYDVVIKGDGKDLSETKCPINFMYVLKYFPAKHILANWNTGQACSFYKSDSFDCYDDAMLESFVFTE